MSFTELFFIMVLGLILFGPEELPKIARTVGKMLYEIKQATNDVQQEVRKVVLDERTPAKNHQSPPGDSDNKPVQEIVREEENVT